MPAISHITLELAREPDHPLGDREHGYHLYLPLKADGSIDGTSRPTLDNAYRVRRFRPGEREIRGRIQRDPDGAWVLDYDDSRYAQGRVRLNNDKLYAGELVSVREDDGPAHAFQVISIRRE